MPGRNLQCKAWWSGQNRLSSVPSRTLVCIGLHSLYTLRCWYLWTSARASCRFVNRNDLAHRLQTLPSWIQMFRHSNSRSSRVRGWHLLRCKCVNMHELPSRPLLRHQGDSRSRDEGDEEVRKWIHLRNRYSCEALPREQHILVSAWILLPELCV